MKTSLRTLAPGMEGICKCGHRQLVHHDVLIAVGHGACLNCPCYKFTWVAYRNDVTGMPERGEA